jgi:DNA-binding winged helix-turn-helix (wHTH) protein
MTTSFQGYVHVSTRTGQRRTARGSRGTAPGPQPTALRPEARGFAIHVGMDESTAAAAGTSLTRVATQLRRYVESVVPGAQVAAAVAIAPTGTPGSDLEVVRQVLGGPSTPPDARSDQTPASVSTGGPGLVIDRGRREARLGGEPVNLRNKEFALLEYLVEHGDRTVRCQELIDALWAHTQEVPHERIIDVHVLRLRSKLGRLRDTVRTVRGHGYRFTEYPDVVVQSARQYSL